MNEPLISVHASPNKRLQWSGRTSRLRNHHELPPPTEPERSVAKSTMKHCLPMVVAIGLATAIGCIHMGASVAARWHSLEATAIMLLSDIVAVIVGLVIFVVSRLSKQRKRVNLYWLSYCVASVSAVLASGSVAAFLRDREISDLIESGITVDCEKVLASHRHHPELAGEGYVRFLPGQRTLIGFQSLSGTFTQFTLRSKRMPLARNYRSMLACARWVLAASTWECEFFTLIRKSRHRGTGSDTHLKCTCGSTKRDSVC